MAKNEIKTANRTTLKPIVLLLVPSSMGTSSMLERVLAAFPETLSANHRIAHRAVVLAHFSVRGELRDIGEEICCTVGAPFHSIGGQSPSATGWLGLLEKIGTRFLILEDMQSLNNLSKSQRAPTLNMLRYAHSRYGLSIMIVAPPAMRPVVMNDPQLAERCRLIEVQPFVATDSALTELLESFLKWCPLRRPSDVVDDMRLRKAIVRRSNGVTRNIVNMLIAVAGFAIVNRDERITFNIWREYLSRAEYG